jgi:cobalt/nickel transport system permease protein
VNATIMGVPALLAYYIFRLRGLVGNNSQVATGVFGFLGGASGLGLAALAAMILLITTAPAVVDVEAERASIYALTLAHVPLMILEGIFTALVVLFLKRVGPALLEA